MEVKRTSLIVSDIILATTFLTRLPLNRIGLHHNETVIMKHATKWFPLVGAIIGLISGVTYLLINELFGTGLNGHPQNTILGFCASAIALGLSTLICGGFHQDGLADISDAFIGGSNKVDRLRILKDSTHGTYAVLTLIFQVFLQISLLATLTPMQGLLALVIINCISRLAPIYLMFSKTASLDETDKLNLGLGASISREINWKDLTIANLIAIIITLPISLYLYPILLITLPTIIYLFYKWTFFKIQGVVGDALGAAEQICETFILFLIVAFIFNGFELSWFGI